MTGVQTCALPICLFYLFPLVSVGEDEEVSIKEVTDAIVKAVGFQGEYTVCDLHFLIN